jgi:hypothetical protein
MVKDTMQQHVQSTQCYSYSLTKPFGVNICKTQRKITKGLSRAVRFLLHWKDHIHVVSALLDTSKLAVVHSPHQQALSFFIIIVFCVARVEPTDPAKVPWCVTWFGPAVWLWDPHSWAHNLSISLPFKLNITSEQPQIPEKGIFFNHHNGNFHVWPTTLS